MGALATIVLLGISSPWGQILGSWQSRVPALLQGTDRALWLNDGGSAGRTAAPTPRPCRPPSLLRTGLVFHGGGGWALCTPILENSGKGRSSQEQGALPVLIGRGSSQHMSLTLRSSLYPLPIPPPGDTSELEQGHPERFPHRCLPHSMPHNRRAWCASTVAGVIAENLR